MTYDPLHEVRDNVAQAEMKLDQAKARHVLAKRAYDKLPRWKLWSRMGLRSDLSDLSFKVSYAAMDVVRAKAQAWDTRERLKL